MKKDAVSTRLAPAAIGPYSQAVGAGGFVFVSGQVPLEAGAGALKGSSVSEQTEQALRNLGAILQEAGLGFRDVVKTTVFMTDLSEFSAMNETYAKFFESPCPARSTVQVAALPKGALVEIEAIAWRGEVH